MKEELLLADKIIESFGCQRSELIAIMQEIQYKNKYLSEDALQLIAEKLNMSVAKVYSVATFYENFSLEAKGKHNIKFALVRRAMCGSHSQFMMPSTST